ncbi:EB domain and Cysteine-rich repeat-containing protein [Aphelenchoides bicaudatus]|nr:EB domain and Cysteine-rich repeat-containing protein [Aphelenchoides bicaudatus]
MTQRRLSVVFALFVAYNCLDAQTANFCPTNMIQLYNGITCQTDQGCQRLSNGFFCYRGYCCANAISLPGGYGSSCASNNQCSFSQAECLGGICYCRTGFNYDGQYCQPSAFNNNPSNPLLTTNPLLADPQLTQRNCGPNEISIGGKCYRLQNYYDECDFTQQCNFIGAVCNQRKCTCSYLDIFNGFQCVRDSMISGIVSCAANQISINNQCYLIANLGDSCVYDQQCRSKVLVGTVACINGVCQQVGQNGGRTRDQGIRCTNPAATPELLGTVPKNCISSLCSAGYHCEYNNYLNQYICCGGSLNGPYGQIKMYPGSSNLPLQCNGINSCTFVDFPNCVYSSTYKYSVCCSQNQCL